MLGALWSKLSSYLADEGKDPATFPNIAYHNINVNSDRNAALGESKRFLDLYYGPVFAPQMIEAWTAAGTPAQCADHLRTLAGDGAKSITLRITAWNQRAQYDLMANEVLQLVLG